MTDSNIYLSTLNTIEQQWSSLAVNSLAVSTVDSAFVLGGKYIISSMGETIRYSALVSPGMTRQSLVLVYIAALPGARMISDGLSAFLLQLTALLSPLEFIVDLQSDQILIRQSELMARTHRVQGLAFLKASLWLIPQLMQSLNQITVQALEPQNARQMADFLSEAYFEALADD